MDSPSITEVEPQVFWRPDPARAGDSVIVRFARWALMCRDTRMADEFDYHGLHAWSVRDPEGFWSAAAGFLEVNFGDPPESAMIEAENGGVQWFPGATLNYAEHALADGPGRHDHDAAIEFVRGDGPARTVNYSELRDLVARARTGLLAAGVGRGDRVVAVAPNCVETLVMFLAAASLGAIWSCCPPDLGTSEILGRFAGLEPSVLLAVDGYLDGDRRIDLDETLAGVRDGLPTVQSTVLVPYLDPSAQLAGSTEWSDFVAVDGVLEFDPVPFDHPLWVCHPSSAGVVQGHGGVALEHLKVLCLHHDLGPGDRLLWSAPTGSVTWNLLASGLLAGATVVLYDGTSTHPDGAALWALAAEYRVRVFGAPAGLLGDCAAAGVRPREHHDLSTLRALVVTAPALPANSFRWVAEHVGNHVQLCPVALNEDIGTVLRSPAPTVAAYPDEPSCPALGVDVAVS